jgi:DNA-binding Lrp family transcriptional regulator
MNRRILAILQRDGRATFQQVAAELKRSESTVRDRIQRMERAGIILGYTAIVDKRALGFNAEGMVLCNVGNERLLQVIEKLRGMEKVLHVFALTGERRLAIRVMAQDNRQLEEIVRKYILPLGVTDVSLHIVTASEIGLCVKPGG